MTDSLDSAPLCDVPNSKKPLNQGQNAAAEAFFGFILGDRKEFGIKGPGGVGKSFWMSHIIDDIMPKYFDTCRLLGIDAQFNEVVMTATTNKAAEVLAQATMRPTSTIQSFMRLKVQEDYSTGVSKLSPRNDWTVHENKIIFVDECSMEDEQLDKYIQKGTHNCKIIYVGDECQLMPVMGSNPLYHPSRDIEWHELTEPMRTDNPDLLAINNQLRETVKTGIFKPIKLVPGSIDLLDNETMPKMLDHYFAKQTLNSRILAYTNKRVMLYNAYVRQLRGLPDDHFTEGELLINNSAVSVGRRMFSVEEEFEVVGVGNVEKIVIDWEPNKVELEVRRYNLRALMGETFYDIPVPVDKEHFGALVNYYKRIKNWSKYYELTKGFPDLRQRDAATGYKAQGSTYDVPFIDLGDISSCRNPDQAARLLYVTFSRARERIFLYGDLAAKFGGLIA